MNIPSELKYTKDHEWLRIHGDGTATVGITEYAQESLGDITFVEFPEAGATLAIWSVTKRWPIGLLSTSRPTKSSAPKPTAMRNIHLRRRAARCGGEASGAAPSAASSSGSIRKPARAKHRPRPGHRRDRD